jgi:malonyl-CoA/methylmalonyl-CoA synthetase
MVDLLAAADHKAPAVLDHHGAVLTYGDLERASERLAAGFVRAGVTKGDRVAYQVQKSPGGLVVHLALLRCGVIQVPLNPDYTDDETALLLRDAEPVMLIREAGREVLAGPWRQLALDAGGSGCVPELDIGGGYPAAPLPDVGPDDGAALLYTSGTTGRPKGALLSHANLEANATTLVNEWEFGPTDRLLHVLPLFHTHGLFVAAHCVLTSGASMVLLPRFDVSEVLDHLPSCSVMMGVPTHYTRLLADERFGAAHCKAVRLFVSGSAPMTPAVHAEFTRRTGAQILERYGMTETSMLTSNPLHGHRRPGTVGPALPGVAIRVVNDRDQPVSDGETGGVQVSGANVFAGYWRRPDLQDETFTDDGWFRTGDLGRFDADGYLELVGRSKDLVITGGLNVYPTDVEVVLDALPGVKESAVIGLPDPDLGEVVVGVVVAEPGALLDPDELRAAARELLAGYQTPKHIVVADSLPRNVMGKVQKSSLRAQLIESAT